MSNKLEAISKLASVGETRQKWTKKRSLHGVNEHFESIFNTVSASAAILRWLLIAALLLGFALGEVHAQEPLPWQQLDTSEQQVLKPYADRWESFSPEQQQRLQKGARRWQRMNSEERAAVRERFQRWQQMPAEQQQRIRERFKEYQALPPEQQQRIRKQMQAFSEMPEDQREELLQRWQSMSVKDREAIREQLRGKTGQQQSPQEEVQGGVVGKETGDAQDTGQEQQSDVSETTTLPEREGGFRDKRMERRSIETPMRRQR